MLGFGICRYPITGDKLPVFLSFLFSVMLRHGLSPTGMLTGTMVPIPKGKWINLACSDNYRVITLSSVFGKLLDTIIMKLEADNLCTNEVQFGFKTSSSTSLCASMVQETVSYFVHGGSNGCALLLDASKAFDRVNYCKLFRTLLNREKCPMVCRLLLNMHLNQKLRVRWETIHSEQFSVTNGVKQGGVISPILFCIYMDNLLHGLAASGIGCHMGNVYAGAFGYADDLILLSPSVAALHKMSDICEKYAHKALSKV